MIRLATWSVLLTLGGLQTAPAVAQQNNADLAKQLANPVLSYTTPTAWTFTTQSESTYDREGEQWSVPVNVVVTKVTKIGGQLISLGVGVRYWADSPDAGPEGFGFRLAVTLPFPR